MISSSRGTLGCQPFVSGSKATRPVGRPAEGQPAQSATLPVSGYLPPAQSRLSCLRARQSVTEPRGRDRGPAVVPVHAFGVTPAPAEGAGLQAGGGP